MVTAHGLDWSYAFESRDRVRPRDVTRVQDEVHSAKGLDHSVWKPIDELGAVGVRHDPDPRRHAGVRTGCDLIVSITTRGARLRTAAMAKISGCPRPNATAPMTGPITPPR